MLSKEINRYIYTHSAEDIIQQGKRIFLDGKVKMLREDREAHAITLTIKDDTYNISSTVEVRNYHDVRALFIRCSCIHSKRNLCKHKIAGLFFIKNLIDKKELQVISVCYNQAHTSVKMNTIDIKVIKAVSTPAMISEATQITRVRKAKIDTPVNGAMHTEITDLDGQVYPIDIKYNGSGEFITSCTCDEHSFVLCKHKMAVFLQILYGYGANYFASENANTNVKKRAFSASGEDAWDEALRAGAMGETKKTAGALDSETLARLKSEILSTRTVNQIEAITFKENMQAYPNFSILVRVKKENIDIHTPSLWKSLKNTNEKDLLRMLRKLTHKDIVAHLTTKRHVFHSSISEEATYKNFMAIPDDLRSLYFDYLYSKVRALATAPAHDVPFYLQTAGKKPIPIRFSPLRAEPLFAITLQKDQVFIIPKARIEDTERNGAVVEDITLSENIFPNPILLFGKTALYTWRKNPYDILLLSYRLQTQKITRQGFQDFAHKHLQHIFQYHHFSIDPQLATITKGKITQTELVVQESERYLHLMFYVYYADVKVEYSHHKYLYTQSNKNITLIERDRAEEDRLFETLYALHSRWVKHETDSSSPFNLVITKEDALTQRWFLNLLETMRTLGVQVKGLEQLRNFSVREVRPSVKLDIQSGIDWLDVKMDIAIEDEVTNIEQIKKMFRSKTNLLTLDSGRVVSVATDWVKKYKLFFDLAEKKEQGHLHFHKSQANLVQAITQEDEFRDYLHVNWNKEAKTLLEKPIDRKVLPPTYLRKVIKNYQKESFQWFLHLKKMGYNGLLGDDMGLGKTLQVLTTLAHEKEQHKKIQTLVVCPTSLMYTWQQEINKFTPSLSFLIYHSGRRANSAEQLKKYDIIISTYGIIRSDISMFKSIGFDYIILDESQYIKNPNSKIYQAVISLQGKHKICLSGTPLQNNTFDLYAQINFLNPHFLGTLSFFKNHFSLPIDRYDDQEIKQVLRNAISPLFLRRTKKEVSPELPDKKVTILHCAMCEKQRHIYNSYRHQFRENLLGLVHKEGVQSHKIHILQALTKLRMICNSPSLIGSGVHYPSVSVKRDLLIEQIKNNVGEHKIVVFSQFLGMLGLIRDALQKINVNFEYLDGTTNAGDRKKAVRNFQEDEACKVFLISLKAGGVGLNLTAADYVYIVDPWWNPTIELQAIDRTHRIGQTKKIFAQRMICVDSIEEKIIALQEKKFKLSKAIIEKTDDSFLKDITTEDLDYLLG